MNGSITGLHHDAGQAGAEIPVEDWFRRKPIAQLLVSFGDVASFLSQSENSINKMKIKNKIEYF